MQSRNLRLTHCASSDEQVSTRVRARTWRWHWPGRWRWRWLWLERWLLLLLLWGRRQSCRQMAGCQPWVLAGGCQATAAQAKLEAVPCTLRLPSKQNLHAQAAACASMGLPPCARAQAHKLNAHVLSLRQAAAELAAVTCHVTHQEAWAAALLCAAAAAAVAGSPACFADPPAAAAAAAACQCAAACQGLGAESLARSGEGSHLTAANAAAAAAAAVVRWAGWEASRCLRHACPGAAAAGPAAVQGITRPC